MLAGYISIPAKKQTTFYMATCRPKEIFHYISFVLVYLQRRFTKRNTLRFITVYEDTLGKAINPTDKFLLTISKNFYTVVSNNFSFLKNVIKGYISNPMRKELIGDESVLPQTVVFPSV